VEARTRKRVAGWAAAGVVTIWIPVAIDQSSFRHNAYLLPVVGLGVVLLYAGLTLTSPAISEKIRALHQGFGTVDPLRYLLTIAASGGALIALLGGGELYAIHKSQQHVAELRKAESPIPVESLGPISQPIPLQPVNSNERKETPKAERAQDHVTKRVNGVPITISAAKEASPRPAAEPPPANVCPNGNCGGTVINPTVNNNYAASQPPPRITWTGSRVEDTAPAPIGSDMPSEPKHPGVRITITLLGRFQFPMFTVLCNRPCQAVNIGTPGASAPSIYLTNNPLVTAAGFRGVPAFLEGGSTVWITVASKDENDITIVGVDPYVAPQ
jgi:hypothetical protein